MKGVKGFQKGHKHSEATKIKIGNSNRGNHYKVKDTSKMHHTAWNKGLKGFGGIGENHWSWKGEKCKKRQERNDPAYANWVMKVKRRDNWKCRVEGIDCNGRCIVHHILSWREFINERYKINNGITLCHFHHPRKRAEEQRFIPIFQKLVEVEEII